jgi:hypothetical protein
VSSLNGRMFAFAGLVCAIPLSFHWSHGGERSLFASFDAADAAEIRVPERHHRGAVRHGYYLPHYSRLYDAYCGDPYIGGGFNGGTYYGGPWIDLRCYPGVY